MRKYLFVLLLTILHINTFGQISFKRGYFIDNSGQKVNCLIKDIDWKNNPTAFQYKLSENEESITASIKLIKEFGVLNISKFIRANVEIDRSSERTEKISVDRDAVFIKEQLFLKELVAGRANLYMYEDDNLRRYFFSKNTSEIKQLIYKCYKTSDNKIRYNNAFKGQLKDAFMDENISIKKIKRLDYRKNELVKFFLDLNGYTGSQIDSHIKKEKRDLFNLTLRPGLTSSSFSMDKKEFDYFEDLNFDRELGFRIGIEAEVIMPFNRNKWSVFLEPTYQYYKTENIGLYKVTEQISKEILLKVDYKSIEVPIGIRHSFFTNKKSKLFVNASLVVDLPLSGHVVGERSEFKNFIDLEIETDNNYAFGMGYNWNNKHSFEIRYSTKRSLINKKLSWDSNYKSLSFIYGFNIF